MNTSKLTIAALALTLSAPFSYTLVGVEPVGNYLSYAALIVAGGNPFLPANQISVAIEGFDVTE